MAETEREPPHVIPTLSYETPVPPAPRLSKLAAASMLVSALGSPCVLGSILTSAPIPRSLFPRFYADGFYLVAALTTIALPAAALVRIRFSGGRRTGWRLAIAALTLSLMLWGLVGLLVLLI